MASHVELNPDDNVLGLSLGMKAMRLALTQKTHKVGTVRIPTGGDTDVIIGDGAQDGANRIDQDGNQLPLVDTSEIEHGVQQAQKDADAAAAEADEAIKQGEQIRQDAQAGIDDARKQAQDAAAKADKARSDLQAEVDANKKATDAAIAKVDAKADKAQSDLESQTTALKTSIANVDAKADQVKADADKISQRVDADKAALDKSIADVDAKAQAVADAAQKSADKANAATVELDKSIQAVDAKAIAAKQAATEAQSKAENVASDLDSANAVIEQHTTELGTLTTKVSNAVTKADSALNVSTEAKQTATEASTTASSAYKDSQTALTQSTSATQTASVAKTTAESASKTATDSLKQSSSAVQTANQVSTILRTEYQTKADADKLYATQSSVTQTSDSIKSDVAKTYATKEALTALQNAADNAIESWRGTGVPTLKNKPAVDWTTDAEKKKHSGDLYYDKATGKAYRFGSDDGKNYSWELNQDSDVTKALADASKAQTSANGAQSAADAAQSTASKAQGDVDQLKVDIPATYATKSSLTQTADSITANVEVVKTTANSAVSAASKAQQTADAVTLNLSKNYQTKAAADAVYSTKADLKATSESISADVYKAQGTADGAVTAASKAQQTADAVTLNLSRNYATKAQADSTYAAKTELKTTADGLQADITRSQQTADGAVTAASKAQATADGINATLSKDYQTSAASDEKYSTKADLKAASDGLSSSLSSVKQTADGAVTASSKAQQTADGISANLSKNYQTKAQADTTYATKTSLKATSDSLTASINSTAKTAQNAVDKTTSLEANLTGFKQTVSETYTTKSDFNSLQIGGTNLCPKSNPYNIGLSNAVKDPSTGVITGTVPTNANATWGASVTPGYATHLKTPYGRRCVISFDVWSEIAATVVVDINNMPESVAAWNGNDNDGWRGGVQPTTTTTTTTTTTNGASACSIPAKQWIRLWVTYSNTSPKNTGKFDIFDTSHIGLRPASTAYQVKFKDFKFELGSRPTEYSPCPSDLQPAGDYSTKSELTQTADGIKAQVSEVSKTASGAMSKATTLEQTANSLSSTITAQGKTLEATTKTANTAKATADSNTTAISQVKTTADGAVNRVSSLEQNLNGFKTTVAKTYQDKAGMSNYATNSALKQTSDTITSQVSEVSKTASGAMSKVTSLEQTANGLSTKITEQGKTLDATVKTANEAKSTADSNKTAISQVSTTASSALTKASTVEQNLNGFKTTVSETYSTKDDVRNLTISGTNLLLVNNLITCYVNGSTGLPVDPYAGKPDGNWVGDVSTKNPIAVSANSTYVLTAYDSMPDTTGFTGRISQFDASGKYINIALNVTIRKAGSLEFTTASTAASIYVGIYACPKYRWKLEKKLQPAGDYATNSSLTQTANQIRGEVSEKYQSKNGMSSYATTSALTQKADEITGKVTEVAKTATGAMGKASSVEQTASALSSKLSETVRTLDSTVQTVNTVKSTADSNKATLTQVAKTASDASSRASSVEQNLNGFKTTVSQTYGRGSNLWVNPTFDPDKPQITSRVNNVTAPNGSGVNLLASRDHHNNATSFPVVPGHTYVITAHVKLIKGNLPLHAGIWYTKQTSGNSYDTYVGAESTSNLNDGWISATWRFTCPNGKSRGCVFFQIEQSANNGPTQWYVANVVCVDVTGLQPAGDYATKSYVNQNAKTIALGVVENYKGSDGSGLATKSDITVAKNSVTSAVASTYATKSGVTQEISSKITQNNNSLDVKFSTKVETQNAQNKANTADSHATDAQSRVGSLEDCINFTTSGVRVGKRSNGKFTGVSALVNTNGTFDLLDASGNLLTRINRHRFQVTGDDGTGSGYLSLSQDGINITVQPTADTSKTYHFQVGKSGVGITAPDGARIECSTSGGLNIETVKFGKIAIGSGGLQFTNDQGWGLKLSAAGLSIKWAGNHTLATGPKAGALYIDGHEIVTR